MLPISAVLPVYHRVQPAEFHRALDSLLTQTSPASEIVVVCDGPVNKEIQTFLEQHESDSLRVVRLVENRGTAVAFQVGIDAATHRWIARQDADDISLAERFELQWQLVESERYAAVGGQMLEFDESPDHIVRKRTLPSTPEHIASYVRINSPMNNPTVILDKQAVAAVGGIHQVHLMEDYDLFARLLSRGYSLISVDEPVVLFQADDGMFRRRTGREMARAELAMQRNLVNYGLVSKGRACLNFVLRQSFRMLPGNTIKSVYRLLFDRNRTGCK